MVFRSYLRHGKEGNNLGEMTDQELKELKIAKAKCLTSLEFFTRYMFKKMYSRKFIVSDHHRLIIDKLEKVLKGECNRLIINMPPRYGKTELAVKAFVSHALALNPSSKFIVLSGSDSLASDNSEGIKDIILHDEYTQMFPGIEIKKDSSGKKKWYTNQSGGVYAVAAGGQVTGFGAGKVDEIEGEDLDSFLDDIDNKLEFAGAIIIDDPIKPDDADSDTLRDKVNLRFDSTIKNRVNSRNTPIIVIMQKLHEYDLCGYILENDPDHWEVLSLPAIKEDGTALWDFKHTLKELCNLKKSNPKVFQAQYMQDPKEGEGYLWKRETLKRFKSSELDESQIESTSGYIDVADQGDDYFAFPLGRLVGDKVFVTDIICNKEGLVYNRPKTASLLDEKKAEYCRVESNNQGFQFANELQKETNTGILKITNTTNKHTRIVVQSGIINEHFYFLDESEIIPGSDYDVFMKQLFRYKKDGTTKRDVDPPDAISGLSQFFRGMFPHLF